MINLTKILSLNKTRDVKSNEYKKNQHNKPAPSPDKKNFQLTDKIE